MRDEFYESSVAPERLSTQKTLLIVYNLFFVFTIIAFVIMLYLWLITFDTGFVLLFGSALLFGVGLYFLKRKLCTFFDYTYISGEIRIIKLINGKVRKKFLIYDAKDVVQVGKVSSTSFIELKASGQYKLKIATPNGLGADNQLYYMAIKKEGEQLLVVLECEEKFLAYVVSYRGKSIIEKDYK